MSYLFCKCGNGRVAVDNKVREFSNAHLEESRDFEIVKCNYCGGEICA